MKFFLTIIGAMLLTGCWTGTPFYSANEGVAAIPAGNYRVRAVVDPVGTDRDTQIGQLLRVSYRDDGSLSIVDGDGDGPEHVIIVPLADVPGFAGGIHVIQADLGQGIAPVGTAVYGLINVFDGGYQLALPQCDGTRRIVAGHRATVSGMLMGHRQCAFPDRASFEAAMRAFAQDPIRWTEYRRSS